MRKRIVSLTLVLALSLLLASITALAAGNVTATYSNESVTLSGNGFAPNTDYFVRIVNQDSAHLIAMLTVTSDNNGQINASVRVGQLENETHNVLVNNTGGVSVAGDAFRTQAGIPGGDNGNGGTDTGAGGGGDTGVGNGTGDGGTGGGGANDTGTGNGATGGGGVGNGGAGTGIGTDIGASDYDGGMPTRINYSFIDGNTWARGSEQDLIINIQRDYSLLSQVRVNGNALTRYEHYSAWPGSTAVALFFEYLESLPLGQHTLEVRFTDGLHLRTQFHTVTAGMAAQMPPDIYVPTVTITEPETPADDGGFIGTPYTQDDVGITTEIAAATAVFGAVPQTGLPDITKLVIVMFASTLLSLLLLTYLFISIKRKRKPNA